jgi:PAS domain S-box-containing protein
MLSDNKPYGNPSLENSEQQNIAKLGEELILARQQLSRQALLNKIIQAMRGTLVLDEILQTTIHQLQVALKVNRCLIFRPDSHNQMAVRYDSEVTDKGKSLIGSYCSFYRHYHKRLSVGESVVLSRIDETLPPEILLEAQKNSICALLIVPLMYQNAYIGGITLVQGDRVSAGVTLGTSLKRSLSSENEPLRESSRLPEAPTSAAAQQLEPLMEECFWGWTAANVEFVQAIADHCAIAIYQAELHQQLQTELAERKQVEEALRQSEARYRAIVEDQTELICRFKPDGTLTFANDAYCRYFNKERSDLIGQKFLPTMPSQDRELISQNFRSLSQGHPINTYEHRIILPSGEIRWQQWSDRAVFDEHGNFIECQAVGRDITKLKQAEADIGMALEKERELSKLRSDVVSLVSHEFRTPLTIIQSSAELLKQYHHGWPEERKLNHFGRIVSAVKHMTQLLDDVLTIGKAEAGQLKFVPSSIDLIAFCGDIVENLELSTSSQHTIDFVRQCDRIEAQMDEKLLGHILTNLLSNAIKYSPEGGRIRFDLLCTSASAVFRIKDAGIGIPAKDIEKLFESFRRASNVGMIPGTGLGLAIVKKCVDLHRGQIAVESELGVGTLFTVTLPLNAHILKDQA